jgi:hypothetical protein
VAQPSSSKKTVHTAAEIGRDFPDPGALFRPTPLWSWNADLSTEEVRRQVREMAARRWGGFFMHTRVGLVTPYLSKEFFDLVKAAVEEAKAGGLKAWIYDEDKWPSGYAGGLVPEEAAEHRLKGIHLCRIGESAPEDEVLQTVDYAGARYAVCAKTGSLGDPWFNYASYVDLMNKGTVERFLEITLDAYRDAVGAEFGETVPGVFTDEPCFLFFGFRGGFLPWTPALPERFRSHCGYTLTSSLCSLFLPIGNYRKVRFDFFDTATRLFKESFTETYERYARQHGLIFTGHFMSEDHMERQTQWIGAAMPHYEHMTWPGIDKLERHIDEHITCKQVSSVADQLGKERTFCETYGGAGQHLTFADRRWISNWEAALGINVTNPHLSLYTMSGERKRDFPANLFYQQPWWRFEDDVNVYLGRLNLALSRGRRDVGVLVLHPIGTAWALYDVLAYQQDRESPIKPYDRHLEELTRRLLGRRLDFHFGDEIIMERHARVAATAESGSGTPTGQDAAADAEHGGRGPRFVVGGSAYACVVVPASITWRSSTISLLEEFAAAGGTVIFSGEVPRYRDMETEIDLPSRLPGSRRAGDIGEAVEMVAAAAPAFARVTRRDLGLVARASTPQATPAELPPAEPESILMHLRLLDDGSRILFLTNSDPAARIPARVELPGAWRVQELDCLRGSSEGLDAAVQRASDTPREGSPEPAADMDRESAPGRTVQTAFDTVFEPGEGRLYLLEPAARQPAGPQSAVLEAAARQPDVLESAALEAAAPEPDPRQPAAPEPAVISLSRWRVGFESPNIMPVDRASLWVDGRAVAEDAPLHLLWDEHFLALEDGTPYEAEYRFTVRGVAQDGTAADLKLIVERLSNLESAELNGVALSSAESERAFNDPGFETVAIGGIVREGENRLRIRGRKYNNITSGARGVGFHRRVPPEIARQYRPTELEAIYLTGTFLVDAREHRDLRLQLGSTADEHIAAPIDTAAAVDIAAPIDIADLGHPFYAGVFEAEAAYEITDAEGSLRLVLEDVRAQAVQVVIDGACIGTLYWPPWHMDLPEWATSPGTHSLCLRMPTDLFNLMGPNRRTDGLPPMTGPDAFRRTEPWTQERFFLPRGFGRAYVTRGVHT